MNPSERAVHVPFGTSTSTSMSSVPEKRLQTVQPRRRIESDKTVSRNKWPFQQGNTNPQTQKAALKPQHGHDYPNATRRDATYSDAIEPTAVPHLYTSTLIHSMDKKYCTVCRRHTVFAHVKYYSVLLL